MPDSGGAPAVLLNPATRSGGLLPRTARIADVGDHPCLMGGLPREKTRTEAGGQPGWNKRTVGGLRFGAAGTWPEGGGTLTVTRSPVAGVAAGLGASSAGVPGATPSPGTTAVGRSGWGEKESAGSSLASTGQLQPCGTTTEPFRAGARGVPELSSRCRRQPVLAFLQAVGCWHHLATQLDGEGFGGPLLQRPIGADKGISTQLVDFTGASSSGGTISQSIATVAGASYRLTLDNSNPRTDERFDLPGLRHSPPRF